MLFAAHHCLCPRGKADVFEHVVDLSFVILEYEIWLMSIIRL
jgi:hypothetical protein